MNQRMVLMTVQVLRLLRPEVLLAAVANGWLALLQGQLALQDDARHSTSALHLPLGLQLALAAAATGGLAGYGTCLNDLLDARRDQAWRLARPLSTGYLAPRNAVVLALLCLLAAMLAAGLLGHASALVALLMAGAILYYNAAGRFFPVTGIVTFALLTAGCMVVPWPRIVWTWPVTLAFLHVAPCGALAYHLGQRRPRLDGARGLLLAAAIAFWMLVLLSTMVWRHTLHVLSRPLLSLTVTAAVLGFLVLTLWLWQQQPRGHTVGGAWARPFFRHALLWLLVYDAAWALGWGRPWWAAMFVALYLIGLLGRRVIAMTLGLLPRPTVRWT